MNARPLQVYIDEAGQIWALDQAKGIAYRLQHTVGVAEYPSAPAASPLSLTADGVRTRIDITPDGGDLLAKSEVGPNAGKSVNLTYGHWA